MRWIFKNPHWVAPHLPSNKENGGRVQVSISLSQKEVYKTWQLTYLLLVPFGINNIRLRHKVFTKWTLKDKLADAVGPYQRETHGEEQRSEWSGGREAKIQHLRKHTNTVVIADVVACWVDVHYAKAELWGLTASGSCSSKVQGGLASL